MSLTWFGASGVSLSSNRDLERIDAIAGRVAEQHRRIVGRAGAGVLDRHLEAELLAALDEAVAVAFVDELVGVREHRTGRGLDADLGLATRGPARCAPP